MTDQQKYLDRLCTKINTGTNVLFVSHMDDYIEGYLDSEHAIWKQKTKTGGVVYIPRYDKEYKIVKASDNARGYKPRYALIDSRISMELLHVIIEPCLIVCANCHYF